MGSSFRPTKIKGSKKVTLDVKYELGHSYTESFEIDNSLWCPACGSKGLWIDCSEGDYYAGPDIYCASCGSHMHFYNRPCQDDSWQGKQILEAIRESTDLMKGDNDGQDRERKSVDTGSDR